MDDRIKQLLKELGNAINESISGSFNVNDQIQRIREEGYNLYVVLDATIGLGRTDETDTPDEIKRQLALTASDIQFRINVNDLAFLRSVGIDPTRKVKVPKRLDAASSRTGDDV